jgi:hypothetical protein
VSKNRRVSIITALLLALVVAFLLDQRILISGTFEIRPQVARELALLPAKIKVGISGWLYPQEDRPSGSSPTLFIPSGILTEAPTNGMATPSEPFPTKQPTISPQATPTPTSSLPVTLDDFAKCLTQRGMNMYGSESCSYCRQQKELFGESFAFINYINCPVNPQVCTDKGIQNYPTWEDSSGRFYVGSQSLNNLSQISGCLL